MKSRVKKTIICILLFSLFCTFCKKNTYALSKTDSIAVVGDSISAPTSYSYLSLLISNYSFYQVDSYAVTSAQTSAMLSQLNNNVIGHGYDGVIVLGGVNDIASGQAAGVIEDNLNTIYGIAKTYGLEVVAIPILPWGCYATSSPTHMATTRSINAYIASNSNVDYFIDIYDSMASSNDCMLTAYTDDGLHPNSFGHQLIAQAVSYALSSPNQTPTATPRPSLSPTSPSPSPTSTWPTITTSPLPSGYTPTPTQPGGVLPVTNIMYDSNFNNILIGSTLIFIGAYLNRYKLKQKSL